MHTCLAQLRACTCTHNGTCEYVCTSLCALLPVIFVLGTKFYVIVKPKKESAMLFVDIPACIAVSGLAYVHVLLALNWVVGFACVVCGG